VNLIAGRNLESNACPADLRLRAHEPLTHRFRRNEKCAADRNGVEPEHGLQHERCVHVPIDRRMRTDEQELQAFVGQRIVIGRLSDELAHHELKCTFALLLHLPVAHLIDQSVARCSHQPGLRVLRNAAAWPCGQRRDERIG
jgi:hypothetical protein